MNIETLLPLVETASKNNNFSVKEKSSELICEFLVLLNKWNMVHNLTSHKKKETLVKEHVVDAWTALVPLRQELKSYKSKETVIGDVGSGNGAPAIIWAICDLRLNVVLIEKTTKKVAFLNHVIGVLKLGDRISTIGKDVKDIKSRQFDVITSRAFSDCEKFLSITKSVAKKNTIWMIMSTITQRQKINEDTLQSLNIKMSSLTPVFIDRKKTNKQILFFKNLN